ncbi:MAG: hydrolase [Aerococcus sp.]|nr:hydrolase [Aerococcus sp.]
MSSEQIRDMKLDHLLTPENAAFIAIDYQPIQVQSIKSMDQEELVTNIVKTAQLAKLYQLPTILSTVNVESGDNKPQIEELSEVFPEIQPIDRTTINSWEDDAFHEAVEKTGRKKLIMTALWTEACLSFPALDAVKEGYEVYAVVDAVGGTSKTAHDTALRRMEQAGVKLISWVQLACELQRDWNRTDTAGEFAKILFG